MQKTSATRAPVTKHLFTWHPVGQQWGRMRPWRPLLRKMAMINMAPKRGADSKSAKAFTRC